MSVGSNPNRGAYVDRNWGGLRCVAAGPCDDAHCTAEACSSVACGGEVVGVLMFVGEFYGHAYCAEHQAPEIDGGEWVARP